MFTDSEQDVQSSTVWSKWELPNCFQTVLSTHWNPGIRLAGQSGRGEEEEGRGKGGGAKEGEKEEESY